MPRSVRLSLTKSIAFGRVSLDGIGIALTFILPYRFRPFDSDDGYFAIESAFLKQLASHDFEGYQFPPTLEAGIYLRGFACFGGRLVKDGRHQQRQQERSTHRIPP